MKTILAAACACFLFSGCVRQIAVSTVSGMVEDGFTAFTEEGDLAFAEQALPGNLKLLEVMLKSQPDDERLLRLASQGYCSYALAFLEDTDTARARDFYLRGKDFGFRLLQEKKMWAEALRTAGLDDIKKALARSDKDDVPAIFWAAFGWGGYIALSLADPDALAGLPKAEEMMRFVARTDSTFYHGGAELFLGTIDGTRPKMLGGNPDRSRTYFQQALRINQGKFLMTYVYYARSYAIQTQDQALFEECLTRVDTTSIDILPQDRLANAVAKKKARLLRLKESELF